MRIACALLVLAACGDDGTPTDVATLMGAMPTVQSAYSKSFVGADGAGNTVLGWKIDFVASPKGTGCKADGVKVVSTIAVFTDQMKGSETVAQLPTGDFSLVLDNPPTATPNSAVGFMTANGLANIEGDLTITGIGKSPDGKTILDLEGSVSAAGQDSNNNNVTLTGTFKAPVCD